jgi:putative endonuclease
MTKKNNRHLKTGCEGENKAVEFLIAKGFQIIERNWRSGHKEIDVIALDNDVLVIVEVKTRRELSETCLEEIMPESKQQHLFEAAENYVEQNNIEKEVRFDLVFVSLQGGNVNIQHHVSAFNAEI